MRALLIIPILLLVACGDAEVNNFEECVAAGNPVMESYPQQCRHGDQVYVEVIETVGGDKDEHGCIGSAGYTWCEAKQKCLRTWEEDCGGASTELSPEECTDLGGRTVNTVAGNTCEENEKEIGDVIGFISPNICCVKNPIAEGFCGTSTLGECKKDSDCITGGCSSQVCQSKDEESINTDCEHRDCYDAELFGLECGCVEDSCQWGPI